MRTTRQITAVVVACIVAAGCSLNEADVSVAATTTEPTTTTPAPTTTAPPTTTAAPPATSALGQTNARPTEDAAFHARMDALWQAIRLNQPELAADSFFPLPAYLQVKAITNPAADWNTRLMGRFQSDISAVHARLAASGPIAATASVTVPEGKVQWITPGRESNKVGYWRVYGTLMHSTSGDVTIASMISWRGEWYVVHLVAIR